MPHESKTLTDHDDIREWVEERGGRPASVMGTGNKSQPGVLRIDFEDYGAGEETLDPITWDDFFAKFDQEHLAFLCQDETADGETSRFFKLINREAA